MQFHRNCASNWKCDDTLWISDHDFLLLACQFLWRSVKGFWCDEGSNFGLFHRLASSPLKHSRTTVQVCDMQSSSMEIDSTVFGMSHFYCGAYGVWSRDMWYHDAATAEHLCWCQTGWCRHLWWCSVELLKLHANHTSRWYGKFWCYQWPPRCFLSPVYVTCHKMAWPVVQKLLVLSHEQATVERGFSINKEVVVENQTLQSLVARRIVKDHIHLSKVLTGLKVRRVATGRRPGGL